MDNNTILALYDEEQRIDVDFPGTRKEQRPHVIRFVSETGGSHFILYSDLEGADVEAVIAEEQAYFSPLGEVEWKVYGHDRPPDLIQRLAKRGFEIEEPEAFMILDLEKARRFDHHALPPEVTMRRLEDASELDDVRLIEETVWGEDCAWVNTSLAVDMALPGYLSIYVAYVEGQPACAGWINFHPNSHFAGLWGGSTVPEHRGKGLYTALLAARMREAAGRGYRFLVIDASPMSRPIVERHGFRVLTMIWPCKWG